MTPELTTPGLTPIAMGDGSQKHANNRHNLLINSNDNITSPISNNDMISPTITSGRQKKEVVVTVDAQVGATLCCSHE